MTLPARLLCFALPALIVAAVVSPLPGTADLCWRAEILSWAMVIGIVALLHYAEKLSNSEGQIRADEAAQWLRCMNNRRCA